MSRRRRIDDDVIVAVGGEPRNLNQAHELVNAGNGDAEQPIDVLPIEPCAAFDDFGDRLTVSSEPAGERAGGVDLGGVEHPATAASRPRYAYRTRGRREPRIERVAERMSGIGGNDEDSAATARGGNGGCGRAGCLSYAALAAKEHESGMEF